MIRPVPIFFLAAAFFLVACGEDAERAKDPEVRHCETVFKRVTKDVREVALVSTQTWPVGDLKNVSITYDGIYGKGDTKLRDIIKCTYIAPIGSAQKKAQRIDAINIMVRGIPMGPAERLLMNTAIQISRPKLLP